MTEEILIKQIVSDKNFFSSVYPVLKLNDFKDPGIKHLYKSIGECYTLYNKVPNIQELELYIESKEMNINEKTVIRNKIEEIKLPLDINKDLIIDSTEKWLKNNRFYEDVILNGAKVIDGESSMTLEEIQMKAEEINKITFKGSAGLDYIKDAEKNFMQYQEVDEGGIKSNLNIVNSATGGGHKQGLFLFMAESNMGKCQKGDTVFNIYLKPELKIRLENFLNDKRNKIQRSYNTSNKEVILESIEVKIQDLFEFLNLDNDNYDKEQFSDEEIYVKSDKNELVPVLGYVKKYNKPIYKCTIEEQEIEVADTHIFRSNGEEVLAKDSKGMYLDTLSEQVLVNNVEFTGYEDVYDLAVPAPHWYTHNENFTNGLISHNTTFLINEAKSALIQGKNVAYFSFEESEIDIRERLDASLMDKNTSEFKDLGLSLKSSFDMLVNKGLGNCKIKSYGPRSASCLTVKTQIEEWKLKENFTPDIIILDSITIIAPISKFGDNTYGIGKAVSEEAKALGSELGISVISAVQTGRQAYGSSEVGMENISESLATAQVASTIVAIIGDSHRPDTRLLSIVKSRKINKSKVKAERVNINTDRQKVWDMDESEKRIYIKSEEKEQIQFLNNVVEASEKIETTGSSVLDELFNR